MGRKLSFGQIGAVARVAFHEIIQHPVIGLLLFFSVGATLLTPLFQFQSFAEDGRLARDSGLASLYLFGILIAAGSAVFQVTGEITRGIAAAALAKPLPRPIYLIGKYLGILCALFLFTVVQTEATLLAERLSPRYSAAHDHADFRVFILSFSLFLAAPLFAALMNRFRGFRFRRTLCLTLPFTLGLALALAGSRPRPNLFSFWPPDLLLAIIPAAWLVFAGLAVVAAVAVLFATRLPSGAGVSFTLAAFILGFLHSLLATRIPQIFLTPLPNFQRFWQCDALAHGGSVSWAILAGTTAYAACLILFFLSCATLAFHSREID